MSFALKKIIACVSFFMTLGYLFAEYDKTLVSWVILDDKKVKAGSVLTIQEGIEFDGIVFAEKMDGKWMAGSHNWARTEKNQSQNPIESTDDDSLIQLAIVYQEKQISIFRDGNLYSSYPAKNIDLLTSDDNFVVFGIRHIGGGGGISGMIEDARIYDRALTVRELSLIHI